MYLGNFEPAFKLVSVVLFMIYFCTEITFFFRNLHFIFGKLRVEFLETCILFLKSSELKCSQNCNRNLSSDFQLFKYHIRNSWGTCDSLH